MNDFKDFLKWILLVTSMMIFMAVIIPVTLFLADFLLRYFKLI